MALYNRLRKNGGIRGHPLQTIFLNQTSELPAGDQIAPEVVQPDRLTERSHCLQRIGAHTRASLRSSFATAVAYPLDGSDSSPQTPLARWLCCASTIASG